MGEWIPFTNGHPSGMAEDVVMGFLTKADKAHGRPVGLPIDNEDTLLIADDTGTRSGVCQPPDATSLLLRHAPDSIPIGRQPCRA
jgi:glucose/arabinose dehydrogenase